VLSNGGQTATMLRPVANCGCRSEGGFSDGAHYVELTCTNMAGQMGFYIGMVLEGVTDLNSNFAEQPQRGCWLLEDLYNIYHDGIKRKVSDLVHFRKKSRVGILLDTKAQRMSFFIDGKRFEHYVFQNMPRGPLYVYASFRGKGSVVQFNPQAPMPF